MYACKYLHKYRCYLQFIHIVTRSIFGNIQCTVGSVRYEMPFGNHQRCSCSMPLLHFEGSFAPKSTMQQLLCLFLQMSSYLWHLSRKATSSFFPGKLLSWKIWSLSSGDPAPKNMFFVGQRRWWEPLGYFWVIPMQQNCLLDIWMWLMHLLLVDEWLQLVIFIHSSSYMP